MTGNKCLGIRKNTDEADKENDNELHLPDVNNNITT